MRVKWGARTLENKRKIRGCKSGCRMNKICEMLDFPGRWLASAKTFVGKIENLHLRHGQFAYGRMNNVRVSQIFIHCAIGEEKCGGASAPLNTINCIRSVVSVHCSRSDIIQIDSCEQREAKMLTRKIVWRNNESENGYGVDKRRIDAFSS